MVSKGTYQELKGRYLEALRREKLNLAERKDLRKQLEDCQKDREQQKAGSLSDSTVHGGDDTDDLRVKLARLTEKYNVVKKRLKDCETHRKQ